MSVVTDWVRDYREHAETINYLATLTYGWLEA